MNDRICDPTSPARGDRHALLAALAELPLNGEVRDGTDVHWAGGQAHDVLEQIIRDARSLLTEGSAVSAILVRMECRECDGEVSTSTRMHDANEFIDPECPHADRVVPDDRIGVTLHCPCCESRDLYEVNVGEVWDEIQGVSLAGGALIVDVFQDGGMDREGDGFACGDCAARLADPDFAQVDFEYRA